MKVSIKEILDNECWEAVADLKGINIHAINEGQLSEDDYIDMTLVEALQVGLLKNTLDGLLED